MDKTAEQIAVQALRDIVEPIDYLRRYAEARGRHLGGAAYHIASSPHFLRQIAREALEAIQEQSNERN